MTWLFNMEMQYANQYFSSIDVLFHEESTRTHASVCTRALALTHTRRHFATDVWLTVSSLLSTETFMSTATSFRSCQPAYFPGLHCLRECICVKWLLTESHARVRVRVYHLHAYGNAVCEPVLHVHTSHVVRRFHI